MTQRVCVRTEKREPQRLKPGSSSSIYVAAKTATHKDFTPKGMRDLLLLKGKEIPQAGKRHRGSE